MVRSFHDDAVLFMIDLLKLLRQEADSNVPVGESTSATEDVYSVFIRLLGLTSVKTANADKDSPSVFEVVLNAVGLGETGAEQTDNLVDNFFKIQTGQTSAQLAQLNSLLKAYKRRLLRYSKVRNSIKINRTKLLIENPSNPLNPDELVQSTPEQTREELASTQKEIRETGDLTGVLQNDLALQEALKRSVRSATSIPENTGPIRSQLSRFINSTAKEAEDKIQRLNTRRTETQNEVNRLEQAEKLLFSGIETFSGPDKTLSLTRVLDVLIFLTDRERSKYNCQKCQFFREGVPGDNAQGQPPQACIFAGEGANAPAPVVRITVQDNNGDPQVLVGRQTEKRNSCKETWGLSSNQYHQPADSVIEQVKIILKG